MDELKEYPVCRRCGRKLKKPEARERGFGDICWTKYNSELRRRLFDNGQGQKTETAEG